MEETKVEKILSDYASFLKSKAANDYESKSSNCLSAETMFKISKYGNQVINSKEKLHVKSCQHCQRVVEQLQWKDFLKIGREDLPAAAGVSGDFGNIPKDLFSNTDVSSMAIICEEQQDGYSVRIESELPLSLIVVFLKVDEELYRLEISEQVSDDLIPSDCIEGWTCVKLLRKT